MARDGCLVVSRERVRVREGRGGDGRVKAVFRCGRAEERDVASELRFVQRYLCA